MQKIHKSKQIPIKALAKSLSARISPISSIQKHSVICFDIEYLKKKSDNYNSRLKIHQIASHAVSPKYFKPAKLQVTQKRYNKSVPDTLVYGNKKVNEVLNYVQDLKEKIKSVVSENKMIEDVLKTKKGKRDDAWKSVEKFKKKLRNKLK